MAEYDWTVSPTAVNQARFGYTWRTSVGSTVQGGTIRVPGIPDNSFTNVMPTFTVTGQQQIGPPAGANSNFKTSVTEYMDTFSKSMGKHTLKFGADIRQEALNVLGPPNPKGLYTFTVTGTNKSGVTNSGNAVASLELGQVNTFAIDIQPNILRERATIAEFFIGDEWKMSPKLTMNIGTRYTLNFPSWEVNNQGAVFNLNTQVLDFVHTARNLECCDFGPRVGLAYQANQSLVIRAGYGMIWFEQTGITTPFTLPQFPFVQTVGQQSQDDINAAFTLGERAHRAGAAAEPELGAGPGSLRIAAEQRFGLLPAMELHRPEDPRSNINLEFGYLGSKNTHLGLPEANLNQLPDQYLSLGSALLKKVPNPYYGQIPASSSLGRAHHNGTAIAARVSAVHQCRTLPRQRREFHVQRRAGELAKRLSHGLTFTFAYTFSKLIDDASSYFSQTIFTGPVLNTTGAADAFNRHLEKDLSRATSQVCSRPAGRTNSSLVENLGLADRRHRSHPVRRHGPRHASNQPRRGLGYAVQRPNRVSNPNDFSNRSCQPLVQHRSLHTAPQFTIGNSSRNPVRGPGLQEADLMLGKTFSLTERFALEFRAEVFNVTNTPPLNDPNGSFGSPAFGTITSAGNPRDYEFALNCTSKRSPNTVSSGQCATIYKWLRCPRSLHPLSRRPIYGPRQSLHSHFSRYRSRMPPMPTPLDSRRAFRPSGAQSRWTAGCTSCYRPIRRPNRGCRLATQPEHS